MRETNSLSSLFSIRRMNEVRINSPYLLIHSDCYYYDIQSCNYNILKALGYDVSQLDNLDKKHRLIQIGLLEKKNPGLVKKIQLAVRNALQYYQKINNVQEDEIIARSFDGFICTRPLQFTTNLSPVILKIDYAFRVLILSPSRRMYLGVIDQKKTPRNEKVVVKGIKVYDAMQKVLDLFADIDFSITTNILNSTHMIIEKILGNEDITFFMIPRSDNKVDLVIEGGTRIAISKDLISQDSSSAIHISNIDKWWYYKTYAKPFVDSILSEFFSWMDMLERS